MKFAFSGSLNPLDEEAVEYQDLAFLRFIDELSPVIVLDGYDEYPDVAGKESIISEFRNITFSLTKAKVILTSRVGEFNVSVDSSQTFEIAPLNEAQIEKFVGRWLPQKEAAARFLSEINSSPFSDTAMKPLSLAHLCAIYERTGLIPDRPKTVYRKIITLLLEDWDQQRSVKRPSAYAKFEPDRKFEFLCNASFYLTTTVNHTVFSTQDFISAYKKICNNFSLDHSQAGMVALEIESHTGLFVQSGFDKFEFVHKSIQEYLTAEYIVKLPSIPSSESVLKGIGAEMAIAVAISSDPSEYMSFLVLEILSRINLPTAFYDAFVSRILLERPDFYQNPRIIIAFFNILTVWVNKGRTYDLRRHDQHIESDMVALYRRLLSLISGKNTIKTLSQYYNTEEIDSEASGVIHLKRKKHLEGRRTLPYVLIPKSLISDGNQ